MIKCLLIDDDLDDQEVFLMVMESISNTIECLTAANAVEGLLLLRSNPELIPDYIFIDVNMPKMNGIDCLKEIKKIDHLKHAKVIMYSTTSDNMILERSLYCGAEDFIVKPVSIKSLKERLAKILEINLSNQI